MMERIEQYKMQYEELLDEFKNYCVSRYTQNELAELWGVNQGTVSRRLANFKKTTPADLFAMASKLERKF